MKRLIGVVSAAALTGALLVGCGSDTEIHCDSMGPVALMSWDAPYPQKPGGGSGGGGGRGSSGGGSKGSSSSSGSKSGGSKPSSGSSGSYGSKLPTSKPRSEYKTPAKPGSSAPSYVGKRNYPGYSQPPTYVRQPDGMLLPFIGGMLVGDALSSPPGEYC